MAIFELNAKVTISISTKIEADSKEEAIRIAELREEIEPYQWGDSGQSERSWVSHEFDGEPFDIEIE